MGEHKNNLKKDDERTDMRVTVFVSLETVTSACLRLTRRSVMPNLAPRPSTVTPLSNSVVTPEGAVICTANGCFSPGAMLPFLWAVVASPSPSSSMSILLTETRDGLVDWQAVAGRQAKS